MLTFQNKVISKIPLLREIIIYFRYKPYQLLHFSLSPTFKLFSRIFSKRKLSINLQTLGANESESLHISNYLAKIEWTFYSHSVNVYHIKNATVIGRLDFIFDGKNFVASDNYCSESHLTFAENNMLCVVRDNKVFFKEKIKKVSHNLSNALWLSGGAAPNYIHWLSEIIPRLIAFDKGEVDKKYPILVDNELHENLLECLNIVNIYNRPIIKIKKFERIFVNNLYVVDEAFYCPFDWKNHIVLSPGEIKPDCISVNFDNLKSLRHLILRNLNLKSINKRSFRRVFILRHSKVRALNNQNELVLMLEKFGFTCIDPSEMSFYDQVRFFLEVELLISQGSAALGNIMFMPQGSKVVILTMFSPYIIPYYFTLYAAPFGVETHLFLCTPKTSKRQHRAHLDMHISVDLFEKYLKEKKLI